MYAFNGYLHAEYKTEICFEIGRRVAEIRGLIFPETFIPRSGLRK